MTSVTRAQARERIYQRWVSNYSLTPFVFDGENTELNDGNVAWARMFVRNTTSNQETLGPAGSRRYIRRGQVLVTLSVPVNTGMDQLDQMMQTAADVFEGVSFQGIRFFDVNTQELGNDGKWEMALVEAFFDYEETK